VLERLKVVPGLESVSGINHLPIAGDNWGIGFTISGRPALAPGEAPGATYRTVMPGYFETMNIRILRGRGLLDRDRLGAADVIVVNEFLANRHWPGDDALGKRVHVETDADEIERTVIGVAANAVRTNLREPTLEEMYLPLLQDRDFLAGAGYGSGYLTYVFRSTGSPAPMMPAVRAAVREVAPTAAIADVTTMEDVLATAAVSDRFLLVLVGVFGALALVLAAVGIYGVMSYTISMRQREMGIRLALGATAGRIARRVVLDGLVVSLAGAAVGAVLAALAGRSMSQLLYRVDPFDVPAFTVAVTVLVGTAVMACYLPARRVRELSPSTRWD
jgi:predicted permease